MFGNNPLENYMVTTGKPYRPPDGYEGNPCPSLDSQYSDCGLDPEYIERLEAEFIGSLNEYLETREKAEMSEATEYDIDVVEDCDFSDEVEEVLHEQDVANANVEITSQRVDRAASDRLTELYKSVRRDRESFGEILDDLLSQFGFVAVDLADLYEEDE